MRMWFSQINCPSFVCAPQEKMTTLGEELSAPDKERFPPLPSQISFNGDRRRAQMELQCRRGQVVNTQTWKGRAALQTGLICLRLSRLADMLGGGWRGVDLSHFYLLLLCQLPSPAALSFGLSRFKTPALREASQWNTRRTGRQTYLQAEVLGNSWGPPIC